MTTASDRFDLFYQNSDNFFYVPMFDDNKVPIEASVFNDATYVIVDRRGDIKLELSLGSGITIEDLDGISVFKVHLDDVDLTFSGSFTHQFSTVDVEGNVLPPAFSRNLVIDRVYKSDE